MKWMYIGLVMVSFCTSASNGAMDYNMNYAQPAYRESSVVFGLVNNKTANNSKSLLTFYKNLSKRVSHLKDLLQGINSHYSSSYIHSGGLARSAYYIDYNSYIMNSINYGNSAYFFIRDHKKLILNQKNLPGLVSLAISLGEQKLDTIESSIKKMTKKQLIEENKRKLRLQKEAEKLKELKDLVSKPKILSHQNNQTEKKIEREKEQQKSIKDEVSQQPSRLAQNHDRDTASLTNDMAIYAAMIGRAKACGLDTRYAMKRVGLWFGHVFPSGSKERKVYLPIFLAGLKYHTEQQKNGQSPDSCASVQRAFNGFDWP